MARLDLSRFYLREDEDERILAIMGGSSGTGRVRKDPADFPTWNGPTPTGLTLTEGDFTPE